MLVTAALQQWLQSLTLHACYSSTAAVVTIAHTACLLQQHCSSGYNRSHCMLVTAALQQWLQSLTLHACYRHRMHASGTRSAIDFGTWSRTPLSRVIVDEELKMQKKRHLPHPHAPRPQRLPRQSRPHPPTYEPQVKVVQTEPVTDQLQASVVEPQAQASIIEPQPRTSSQAEPSTEKPQPPAPAVEPQPQSSVVTPQPQRSMVEPQPCPPEVKQQPQLSVVVVEPQGSTVKSCPPEREPGAEHRAREPHPLVHEQRPQELYTHEPPYTTTRGVIPPTTSIIIAC